MEKLKEALNEICKLNEVHKIGMTKEEIDTVINEMKNLSEAKKTDFACKLVGVHHHAALLHLINEHEKKMLAPE
ncbi:hypothetical protein ACPCZR_30450 [Bacillus bombysepticus]